MSKSALPTGRSLVLGLCSASLMVLSLAGCKHAEQTGHVAGWSLVDPSQRHPIMVSNQQANLSVRVAHGAAGLSPHQRSNLLDFLARHQAGKNARVVLQVPSGAPNEVSSVRASNEIRQILGAHGISSVTMESYSDDHDPQPPIRVAFLRFVAEAPECGRWPENLAQNSHHLNWHNFGCAGQRNLAAMVANPADLLGPRDIEPRVAERRSRVWDGYVKGESTVAKKDESEKIKVKGAE